MNQKTKIKNLEIKVNERDNKIFYWINKCNDYEDFIFELFNSNESLNIKYGSKFNKIREN